MLSYFIREATQRVVTIELLDGRALSNYRNFNFMKLVDYYADWCGPCLMMKPVVEEVMAGLSGITLEEVNVDKDQDRAGKANVMSIPTFVIEDDNGKELDRKIGGLGKEDFQKWVSSFIK